MTEDSERERPSWHGAVVGQAISEMEQAGRAVGGDLPPMCATCAFRPDCMTNLMASTLLDAFKCAVGADPSVFACHHGLADGEPTRTCSGWLAAQRASFEDVRRIADAMCGELADVPTDGDTIRAAFDAWIAEVDPNGSLNDYERGRLYLGPAGSSVRTHIAEIRRKNGEGSGAGAE